MNLLEDLKNIIKNDTEHNLKVEVDSFGVTVFLDYDPSNECKENMLIPIRYETIEEFAYIPDDKYRELYKPDDYGIDLSEITLIKKIMKYLEKNKEEINKLCKGYLCEYR